MTWRERIVAARERGEFTEEEQRLAGCSFTREMKSLMPFAGYACCAVGEQAERYGAELIFGAPVAWSGLVPLDTALRDWGGEFAGAVSGREFDMAESLLDKIEDRAMQLKREARSSRRTRRAWLERAAVTQPAMPKAKRSPGSPRQRAPKKGPTR